MMRVQARRLNKTTLFVVTLVALALICGLLFTAIPLNNVLAKAMSVPATESDNQVFNFNNFTEGEYSQSSVIELNSATTQTITDFGTADTGNGAYFSSHNSWYSGVTAGVKYLLYFYTFKLSDALYEELNNGNYTITVSGTSTTDAVDGNSDTFSYLYVGLGYASSDDVAKSLNGFNEIKATVGTEALKIPQQTTNANPNTISNYDFSSTTGENVGSGYKYLRVGMYSRPWNRGNTNFNINLSNIELIIAPMAPTMSMPSDYNTANNRQWTQTEMVEYFTQPSNSIETISSLNYSDTIDTFTSIDNTTKFVSSSNGKFTASDAWSYSSAPGGSDVLYHIGFMHTYRLTDTIYNSLLNNGASLSLSMSANIYDENQDTPDARLWLYAGIGTASSDSSAVRYNGFKQVQARYNSYIYYSSSNNFSNVGLDTYFQATSSNTGYKYLRIAFLTEVWPGGSTNNLGLNSVRINLTMEERVATDSTVPTVNSMTRPSTWGEPTFYDYASHSANFFQQQSMVEIGNNGNSLTSSNTSYFPTSGKGIAVTGFGTNATSTSDSTAYAFFSGTTSTITTSGTPDSFTSPYTHDFDHISGEASQTGFFYTLKLTETTYNALLSGAITLNLQTPSLSGSGLGDSRGRAEFVGYLGLGYAASDANAKNVNAFTEIKGYVGNMCTYYGSGGGTNGSATDCNISNFNFTQTGVQSSGVAGNGNTKYLRFGVWARYYVANTEADCSGVKLSCGSLSFSMTPTTDTEAPSIPTFSSTDGVTSSNSVTITDASGLKSYTINGQTVKVAKISNTSMSANTTITLPSYGTYTISAVDIWDNATSSSVTIDYFYAYVYAQANTDGIQGDYSGGKIVFNANYSNGTGYQTQQITNNGPYNSTFNIWAKPNDGYYFAGFLLGDHYTSINLDLTSFSISDNKLKSGTNGKYSTINTSAREYMFTWNIYTNAIIPADGKFYITAYFKSIPTTNESATYDATAKSVIIGEVSNAPNEGTIGKETVSYTDSNNNTTTTAPIKAGTYLATSKVTWNGNVVGLKTENLVIAQKEITATYSLSSNNRNYNGSADLSTFVNYSLSGVVSGDEDLVGLNIVANTQDANAGVNKTLSISATPNGENGANYLLTNPTSTAFTFTINAKPVTVTFTTTGKDYDGTNVATVNAPSIVGVLDGESISYNDLSATYADKYAGVDKKVTLTNPQATAGANTSLANYDITTNADSLYATISKIALEVTYTVSPTKVYDGNTTATVTNVQISGYLNNDNEGLTPVISANYVDANVNYGISVNVNIDLTGSESINYSWTETGTTTADITTRNLTITAENNTKVYGEDEPTLNYIITSTDGKTDGTFASVEDEQNASITLTRGPGANVGDYVITLSLNNANSNYFLRAGNGTFTITARPVIVTLQVQESIYGDEIVVSDTAYDVSAKNGYAYLGEDLGVDIVKDEGIVVGEYALTATASNGNYDVEFVATNKYVITKRDLTITLSKQNGTYGEENVVSQTAFTAPNLASGDVVELVITRDEGTNQGLYALHGVLDTESEHYSKIVDNYNVTIDASEKYAVAAREISIIILPQSAVYGESIVLNQLAIEIDSANSRYDLAEGDTIATLGITLTKKEGTEVGEYEITHGEYNDNYFIKNTTNGTFTITKATLTATYEDEKITYGETPVGAITYSGYKYDDEGKAGVLTTAPSVDFSTLPHTGEYITAYVDGYTIAPSGGDAKNYEFNFISGTLIVNKAAVRVEYTEEITYGSAPVTDITASEFKVSGILEGDSASALNVSANLPTNAGTYPITASEFTFTSTNYEVTAISGTLVVNKKALDLTITNSGVLVYGDEINLTITYGSLENGFVNGEDESVIDSKAVVDFSAITTSSGHVKAGTHTLADYLTEASDNNYEIIHNLVESITIGKGKVVLAYSGESKPYDGIVPVASKSAVVVTSGNFAEGEDLEYLIANGLNYDLIVSGAKANAGSYIVYATTPSGVENYDVTISRGNYIINKVKLTATYEGETITFGGTPVGNVTYEGFVNEENESAITTFASVPFNTISEVTVLGENSYINANSEGYTIAPEGANATNYDFEYVVGKLIVNKANATLTLKDQTSVYGETINVQQGADYYEVSGLLEGDALTSVTISKAEGTLVGNYTLSATVVAPNYNVSVENADYVITKATLAVTITFLQPSVVDIEVADLTSADFKVSYSGFVSGDDASLINTPVVVDLVALKAKVTGEGEYTIDYVEGSDDQYDFDYVNIGTIIVVVSEKDVDISGLSFVGKEVTYNGEEQYIYVTWVNQPEDVEVEISYTYSETNHANAGSYSVIASFQVKTAGYKNNVPSMQATLTITPILVEITLAPQGSVYGEEVVVDQLAYSVTGGNVLEDESLGVTIIKNENMNANHGEYDLTATISNTNYKLTNVVGNIYTISSIDVTVTLLDQIGEYGLVATIDQTKYEITAGALVSVSDMVITLSVEDSAIYEVGKSYNITAEIAPNPWYVFTVVEAKYTVTARNIQITLNNKNATYGDVVSAETTFVVTSGSLVNDSDDLGLTFTVTTAEKYVVNGDYTISATASNDNYNVEVISAKYVVGVKAIKIVVKNQESTYGETYLIKHDFELAEGYALVNGDVEADLGVKVSVVDYSYVVGTYVLTATYTNVNYDVEVVKGTYEIKKAETVFYTEKLIKSYDYTGKAVNFRTANSYVYTNREDSQANIKLPTEQVINAGTYLVTFSINESANYLAASVQVEIVVNKVAPVVDMNVLRAKTYVYNGVDQHITASVEELVVKGDKSEVSFSWKNNTFRNVPEGGKLAVEVSLSETTNYTSATFTQEVVINKAKYNFTGLDYAFESITTPYDGNEYQVEVVNLPAGITVSYAYGEETQVEPFKFKNAGNYLVNAIYNYDFVNYERPVEFINSAAVQITRIDIKVEVVDQRGYYGDKPVFDPEGVKIVSGNFVEGDELSGLELELEPKDAYLAGIYYNLVAKTSSSGNYNVTIISGTYYILPRPITVTIDNKDSQYGDEDVPFTFQVTEGGLVEGDVLNASLVREEGKTPGEYAISGEITNRNYTITVINGTYTITPRVITVEVYNQEGTSQSQINKKAYKTFGKILKGDNLNIQVVGEIGTTPGDYPLTISYNANPNYNVIVKEGVFTLRKVAKISVNNPFVYKLYDGVPYVFDVEVSSGATPVFSVDGIYVENAFTEVGVYNLTINADGIGEFASPDAYRLTFEIRPTELVAEHEGIYFKVTKEDGFGAEERLEVQQDLSVVLTGDDFTSKVDKAFTLYIVQGEERIPLEEYMQGKEVHILIKLNEELTEIGAETWFVDSNSNVLHEATAPTEEGYVEVTLEGGNHVLFVTARNEAAPILVVGSGMAFIFIVMAFFFLFRKKFIN